MMALSSLTLAVILFTMGLSPIYGTLTVTIDPSYNPYIITIDEKAPSLICEVDNSSLSNLQHTWYHNGTEVQNGKSRYTSSSVGLALNGVYECKVNSDAGNGSASIRIQVQYGPTINVLANRNITEFDDLAVDCEVSSNPVSNIYWTRSKDSSFRQTGSLLRVQNIPRSLSDTYTCQAENTLRPSSRITPENKTDSEDITINVQYPPTTELVPLYNPYRTYEGQTGFQIKCNVINANPNNPTVKWLRNNSSVTSSTSILTSSNITRSFEGTYTCIAQNDIGISSEIAEIEVQYEPIITPITNKFIPETGTIDITCKATAVPPVNRIWWTLPNGNVVNSARLYLTKVQRSQSGAYTCNAENTLTPSGESQKTRNKTLSITIDVQYSAGSSLTLSPSHRSVYITEGSTLPQVTCSAVCNPACSYRWRTARSQTIKSKYLNLSNVNRRDAGTYICEAYNNVGTSTANFTLTVHYRPDFKSVRFKDNSVLENKEVTFTCTVDSVPTSDLTMEFNGSKTFLASNTLYTEYTMPKTTCLHTGIYYCIAKNIIGNSSFSTFLNVYCSPRLDTTIKEKKVTMVKLDENSNNLNISIRIIANPQPDMSWTFRDTSGLYKPISETDDDIDIEKKFDRPFFDVRFIKYNFSSADDGEYSVIFKNSHGDTIYTFVTTDKMPPPSSIVGPVVGGTFAVLVLVGVIVLLVFLQRRKQLCFKENSCKIDFKFRRKPKNTNEESPYNSAFEETINNIINNPKIKETRKKENIEEPELEPSQTYETLRKKSERIYMTQNNQQTARAGNIESEKANYANVDLAKPSEHPYQNINITQKTNQKEPQPSIDIESAEQRTWEQQTPLPTAIEDRKKETDQVSKSVAAVPKTKTTPVPKQAQAAPDKKTKQAMMPKSNAGVQKSKPVKEQYAFAGHIKSSDDRGTPNSSDRQRPKQEAKTAPTAVPKIKSNTSDDIKARLNSLFENKDH